MGHAAAPLSSIINSTLDSINWAQYIEIFVQFNIFLDQAPSGRSLPKRTGASDLGARTEAGTTAADIRFASSMPTIPSHDAILIDMTTV